MMILKPGMIVQYLQGAGAIYEVTPQGELHQLRNWKGEDVEDLDRTFPPSSGFGLREVADPRKPKFPPPSAPELSPPFHLFERLEAYALDLHAEQIAAGGHADESSLQRIRDGIQGEIVRLGKVAGEFDRHMFRLDNLGGGAKTFNDLRVRILPVIERPAGPALTRLASQLYDVERTDSETDEELRARCIAKWKAVWP